ncbi:MAG: hypothetical protein ACXAC6_01200, partial [Candidatus Hodarchaeales archaeon]
FLTSESQGIIFNFKNTKCLKVLKPMLRDLFEYQRDDKKMRIKKLTATFVIVVLSVTLYFTTINVIGHNTIVVPIDYPSIQEAVDAADSGDTLIVNSGEYKGAVINKSLTIIGLEGAEIVSGNDLYDTDGFDIFLEGHGTTIRGFRFENLIWGIYGYSVNSLNIMVNTFDGVNFAISNWFGENWQITHNTIEYHYPGVHFTPHVDGIIIAQASGNLVAHNKIRLEVMNTAIEATAGIIMASYGLSVENNILEKNHITINSQSIQRGSIVLMDIPALLGESIQIQNNFIRKNTFHGTTQIIDLLPQKLGDWNIIEDNRWKKS